MGITRQPDVRTARIISSSISLTVQQPMRWSVKFDGKNEVRTLDSDNYKYYYHQFVFRMSSKNKSIGTRNSLLRNLVSNSMSLDWTEKSLLKCHNFSLKVKKHQQLRGEGGRGCLCLRDVSTILLTYLHSLFMLSRLMTRKNLA